MHDILTGFQLCNSMTKKKKQLNAVTQKSLKKKYRNSTKEKMRKIKG